MTLQLKVRQNSYFDSVQLMFVSSTLRNITGVKQALVAMATSTNKAIFKELGAAREELEQADANDLIIGIEAEDKSIFDQAFAQMEALLKNKKVNSSKSRSYHSFDEALAETPKANLCVISVPGQYAKVEAEKALNSGLHVHLFSDNVSIEDEVYLKQLALKKGLLCMGPDCGVSNINGVSLLVGSITANGPIGVIGATGAGLQQIAALIDIAGSGVSQVIGTGGRDLRDEIGGITMLLAFDVLENDPKTKVIVMVSRKPGDQCFSNILKRIEICKKPVICNLMGCNLKSIESVGAVAAENLEEAAVKALEQLQLPYPMANNSNEIEQLAKIACLDMTEEQKHVRGLYCSGTFCDEAIAVMTPVLGTIHSNVGAEIGSRSPDLESLKDNTVIDFGEEEFTQGRPHPVLDPDTRRRAILKVTKDEKTAVILMDFILGPAVHPDPVGAVIDDIRSAKKFARDKGADLAVVGFVCGTDHDPQNRTSQEKLLKDAGVIVVASNVQAAVLAAKIILVRQGGTSGK